MSVTIETGEERLATILTVMLAVHHGSEEPAQAAMVLGREKLTKGPVRNAIPMESEATPAYPDRIGRVRVWRNHCEFIMTCAGAEISLQARLKSTGRAVCTVYSRARGRIRHEQIAELACLMTPWLVKHPAWLAALLGALGQSGYHGERVLYDALYTRVYERRHEIDRPEALRGHWKMTEDKGATNGNS